MLVDPEVGSACGESMACPQRSSASSASTAATALRAARRVSATCSKRLSTRKAPSTWVESVRCRPRTRTYPRALQAASRASSRYRPAGRLLTEGLSPRATIRAHLRSVGVPPRHCQMPQRYLGPGLRLLRRRHEQLLDCQLVLGLGCLLRRLQPHHAWGWVRRAVCKGCLLVVVHRPLQTLPPPPPSRDTAPSRLDCQHRRMRDRAVAGTHYVRVIVAPRLPLALPQTWPQLPGSGSLSLLPCTWLPDSESPAMFIGGDGSQAQRELVATSTLRLLSVLSIASMRGHRPAAGRSRASPGQPSHLMHPVSRSGSTPMPGHQPHGSGPVSADELLRTEVFARTRRTATGGGAASGRPPFDRPPLVRSFRRVVTG